MRLRSLTWVCALQKVSSELLQGQNTWARRFMAAIIQGAIIVGLTVFLVLGQISILKPEVSRVIASGGAGTWFTFGYLSYILVGVIGRSRFFDILSLSGREFYKGSQCAGMGSLAFDEYLEQV